MFSSVVHVHINVQFHKEKRELLVLIVKRRQKFCVHVYSKMFKFLAENFSVFLKELSCS
jgi:hypothetical protein